MNKCKDCKIFNYCSDEPYENDENKELKIEYKKIVFI